MQYLVAASLSLIRYDENELVIIQRMGQLANQRAGILLWIIILNGWILVVVFR